MIDNIEDAASMADQSADDGRLYVVPAFTGLSAPYWDPNANGASFGITQKKPPSMTIFGQRWNQLRIRPLISFIV